MRREGKGGGLEEEGGCRNGWEAGTRSRKAAGNYTRMPVSATPMATIAPFFTYVLTSSHEESARGSDCHDAHADGSATGGHGCR